MPSTSAQVMKDAATVVLLAAPVRSGGAPAVLLLERPSQAKFAPGTQVFPGGSVDVADLDPGWANVIHLPSDGDPDPRASLATRLAGVRETFEETGILLARRGDGSPATAEDLRRLTELRTVVRSGHAESFRAGLVDAGLEPDLEGLVFCAHWITPAGVPRRFDTRFFLSRLPPGQVAQPDPLGEHVSLRWVDPTNALEDAELGLCQLLPPTRAVLRQVAQARSVEVAMELARHATVATIQPLLEDVTEENYPGLDVSRLKERSPR